MHARSNHWSSGHAASSHDRSPEDAYPPEPSLRQQWRALSASDRVEVAALGIAIVLLLWSLALFVVLAAQAR